MSYTLKRPIEILDDLRSKIQADYATNEYILEKISEALAEMTDIKNSINGKRELIYLNKTGLSSDDVKETDLYKQIDALSIGESMYATVPNSDTLKFTLVVIKRESLQKKCFRSHLFSNMSYFITRIK